MSGPMNCGACGICTSCWASAGGVRNTMNCIDCTESINESERRNARACSCCHGAMHAECAMSSLEGEDFCEACYYGDSAAFTLQMAKGAEA